MEKMNSLFVNLADALDQNNIKQALFWLHKIAAEFKAASSDQQITQICQDQIKKIEKFQDLKFDHSYFYYMTSSDYKSKFAGYLGAEYPNYTDEALDSLHHHNEIVFKIIEEIFPPSDKHMLAPEKISYLESADIMDEQITLCAIMQLREEHQHYIEDHLKQEISKNFKNVLQITPEGHCEFKEPSLQGLNTAARESKQEYDQVVKEFVKLEGEIVALTSALDKAHTEQKMAQQSLDDVQAKIQSDSVEIFLRNHKIDENHVFKLDNNININFRKKLSAISDKEEAIRNLKNEILEKQTQQQNIEEAIPDLTQQITILRKTLLSIEKEIGRSNEQTITERTETHLFSMQTLIEEMDLLKIFIKLLKGQLAAQNPANDAKLNRTASFMAKMGEVFTSKLSIGNPAEPVLASTSAELIKGLTLEGFLQENPDIGEKYFFKADELNSIYIGKLEQRYAELNENVKKKTAEHDAGYRDILQQSDELKKKLIESKTSKSAQLERLEKSLQEKKQLGSDLVSSIETHESNLMLKENELNILKVNLVQEYHQLLVEEKESIISDLQSKLDAEQRKLLQVEIRLSAKKAPAKHDSDALNSAEKSHNETAKKIKDKFNYAQELMKIADIPEHTAKNKKIAIEDLISQNKPLLVPDEKIGSKVLKFLNILTSIPTLVRSFITKGRNAFNSPEKILTKSSEDLLQPLKNFQPSEDYELAELHHPTTH